MDTVKIGKQILQFACHYSRQKIRALFAVFVYNAHCMVNGDCWGEREKWQWGRDGRGLLWGFTEMAVVLEWVVEHISSCKGER
jgi:hypothetical protein